MNSWLPVILILLNTISFSVSGQKSINGFNLSNTNIPSDEILPGGPPRDGIPSIDDPKFQKGKTSGILNDEDRILGIYYNGVAKAYPIRIMNYHEIVNDDFSGIPVAVTYCPLCGSGVAFKSEINGKKVEFGVSGLLYNSDVLMYDRSTQSLWSQLLAEAVSGPLIGTELKSVPLSNTTWRRWREIHPNSLVLSENTGYVRDYTRTPYRDYENRETLYFPVSEKSDEFHPKELVLGVRIRNTYKAYPFSELEKTNGRLSETINQVNFEIFYDSESRTAEVLNKQVEQIITYWFAWYTFHPETEVFRKK